MNAYTPHVLGRRPHGSARLVFQQQQNLLARLAALGPKQPEHGSSCQASQKDRSLIERAHLAHSSKRNFPYKNRGKAWILVGGRLSVQTASTKGNVGRIVNEALSVRQGCTK